jgi:cytochrome c-type biogenesis protein CcmH/NrfG
MAAQPRSAPGRKPGVPTQQAYGTAAAGLLIGLVAGYFLLGTAKSPALANSQPARNATAIAAGVAPGTHPKLTLDQMKQMADVKAATLIEQSKADPKNTALLIQIATIYQASHQFKEAGDYFGKALQIEPKNVSARTELASCLYYSGDSDAALSQLNQALKYDPTDANSLFNLGMIKYRGENDPKGAIAAWQQLLKAHPDLDRKSAVEAMISEAQGKLTEKK